MMQTVLTLLGFVLCLVARADGRDDKSGQPRDLGIPPIKRPAPSPLLAEPTDKELRDADLTDIYQPAKARLKEKEAALLRIDKSVDEAPTEAREAQRRAQRVAAALEVVDAAQAVDRILFPVYLGRLKGKELDNGPFAKLSEKAVATFREGKAGQANQLLRILVELQGFNVALEDPGLKARLDTRAKAEDVSAARQKATAALATTTTKAVAAQEPLGLQAAHKALDDGHDAYYALVGIVTARPQATLKGHKGTVGDIRFAPVGRLVSNTDADGVKVWDLDKATEVLAIKDAGRLLGMSPDGTRITTVKSKPAGTLKYTSTVQRWDLETGAGGDVFSLTTTDFFTCMSPDGKYLAGGRSATLWDAATGKEVRKMKTPGQPRSFSPDGKRLAGHDGGSLKVWDTESGDVLVTIRDAHAGSVALVNFSPDGKSLVSSGLGDEVKVWDSAEGKPLRTIHCRGTRPSSLAVSPDGKKIATGGREKVKIWDATTGQCLLVLLGNTEAAYSRLQFSPDGKRVSSAEHVVTARGVSDQTAVRVWELLE